MTKKDLIAELDGDPFRPLRLHMVSGKVMDIVGPNAAHPLSDALLVLRNPILGSSQAEGYDVLAYYNIERIERLHIGKNGHKKRKRA